MKNVLKDVMVVGLLMGAANVCAMDPGTKDDSKNILTLKKDIAQTFGVLDKLPETDLPGINTQAVALADEAKRLAELTKPKVAVPDADYFKETHEHPW